MISTDPCPQENLSRFKVHVRLCDHDHSAPNALLLCCDCTVVPGGVPSNDLGATERWPSFFTGQTMLNPLKWKYEDRVGLLVSTIAGAGFGKWIARHTYLGAHRRSRRWRGVLFWSGFSLAAHALLPSSPIRYHVICRSNAE